MYGYAVLRLLKEEDLADAGCVCGEPAMWASMHGVRRGRGRIPAEALTASDLFEELCDGCFRRVVPEVERDGWARRRDC